MQASDRSRIALGKHQISLARNDKPVTAIKRILVSEVVIFLCPCPAVQIVLKPCQPAGQITNFPE